MTMLEHMQEIKRLCEETPKPCNRDNCEVADFCMSYFNDEEGHECLPVYWELD